MGGHTSVNETAETAPGPGVRALFTLGPELLRRDPVAVAVDLRERYGHMVRIPPIYPGLERPAYLATHPDDVQYILQSHPDAFRGLDIPGSADFAAAVEGSILGPPEGNDPKWWIRRLRQIAPEFSERTTTDYAALIRETTTTLAEYAGGKASSATVSATAARSGRARLSDGQPDPAAVRTDTPGVVRLLPLMSRLSVRLIGVSLFGPDVRIHEAAVIRAVARLRRAFKRRTFGVVTGVVSRRLPDWVPSFSAPLRRLRSPTTEERGDPLGTLHEVAEAMVARRVRAPGVFDDAITTWLTRPDPVTDETLTPENACNEVAGLLIAGFATVSAALTWAVYLAAIHPDVGERIHDEVQQSDLFGSLEDARDASDEISNRAEVFSDHSFTHRVWREALRLYPTLPVFGRSARQSIELGGYAIEPDAPVFVSPYVTHRDPAFWNHPTEFDPDRFLPDQRCDRPEFAYYPFSAGPHGCLGREIATTEGVIALAALFRNYRVTVADGTDDVGVNSAINLHPDRSLSVRLRRRNGG